MEGLRQLLRGMCHPCSLRCFFLSPLRGLLHFFASYPQLALWAALFRRFAAGVWRALVNSITRLWSPNSARKPTFIHESPHSYRTLVAALNGLAEYARQQAGESSDRDSQAGLWTFPCRRASVVATTTFRALSEHDFYSFAPALVNSYEFPFDLGRDVAQQRVGCGMNVQGGRHQVQQRLFGR